MKILTAEQTRMLEAKASENGMEASLLMENAGTGAAKVICKSIGARGKTVTVICSQGNNGGDGFVVARKLAEEGADVTVILAAGYPESREANFMYKRTRGLGIKTYLWIERPDVCLRLISGCDIIVDALFGTGFHPPCKSPIDEILTAVRESRAFVAALDIPTGVVCDTGAVTLNCIEADITVSFGALKPCHVLMPGAACCGEISVTSLGIPAVLLDEIPHAMQTVEYDEDVKAKFSPRPPETHKGDCGRLLNISGSVGMVGAAVLSSKAALRCGAGLVETAIPRSVYGITAVNLVEPVFTLLQENTRGTVSAVNLDLLETRAEACSAMLIGCGLGLNEDTEQLVAGLLSHTTIPTVLDADGINAICDNLDLLKATRGRVILTPHMGEMARLLGADTDYVADNRYTCVKELSQTYNVTTVLKGCNTLIASPDGQVYVNRTGNPGMATGGSGDVLAGMIASFLAQGMTPLDAAVCGVHLHGLAGDICADTLSQHSLLPSDLVNALPRLFLKIEQ